MRVFLGCDPKYLLLILPCSSDSYLLRVEWLSFWMIPQRFLWHTLRDRSRAGEKGWVQAARTASAIARTAEVLPQMVYQYLWSICVKFWRECVYRFGKRWVFCWRRRRVRLWEVFWWCCQQSGGCLSFFLSWLVSNYKQNSHYLWLKINHNIT